MIHSERDDLDPGTVGSVQLYELVGLDRARCEEQVGAADDRRLGQRPTGLGKRLDLLRARFGPHTVERVERRHERHVEAVLDGMAGQPGEPVVGVHRSGTFVRLAEAAGSRRPSPGDEAGHVGDHTLGELLDVSFELFLRDGRRRPGGDVMDLEARLDEDRVGQIRRVAPRVQVTGHAGPC